MQPVMVDRQLSDGRHGFGGNGVRLLYGDALADWSSFSNAASARCCSAAKLGSTGAGSFDSSAGQGSSAGLRLVAAENGTIKKTMLLRTSPLQGRRFI